MKKSPTILILILALTVLAGCAASAATLPPETQAAPMPEQTEPAPAMLTAEEARAIALADAGLTAEAVTGLRTEFETDDGTPEYEVDFRSGDYEYDYTIHAETGAVLSRGKEYDPPAPRETAPPATETPTEAPAAVTAPITADRAISIALSHAGLSRADVKGLEAEYDVDDGVPLYEVQFRHDRLEYDYEIHAETGKILNAERDD